MRLLKMPQHQMCPRLHSHDESCSYQQCTVRNIICYQPQVPGNPSPPPSSTCYPGGNVFITPRSASWCYDGERNAILLAHRLATLRDSASPSGSNRTTSHAHVLNASLLGALSKPLCWVGNKTQSAQEGTQCFSHQVVAWREVSHSMKGGGWRVSSWTFLEWLITLL